MNVDSLAILAGGRSSRMGAPKGLVPYQGKTWLEHQVSNAIKCGIKNIAIVLGYDEEKYRAALPSLSELFIVNLLPEFGPFSSIQRSCTHFSGQDLFILPVDVPCPEKSTWEILSETAGEACVPLYENRGGHPVKISDELSRFLQILDPKVSRLDLILREKNVSRISVDDPRVICNLNTLEDFEKL